MVMQDYGAGISRPPSLWFHVAPEGQMAERYAVDGEIFREGVSRSRRGNPMAHFYRDRGHVYGSSPEYWKAGRRICWVTRGT